MNVNHIFSLQLQSYHFFFLMKHENNHLTIDLGFVKGKKKKKKIMNLQCFTITEGNCLHLLQLQKRVACILL